METLDQFRKRMHEAAMPAMQAHCDEIDRLAFSRLIDRFYSPRRIDGTFNHPTEGQPCPKQQPPQAMTASK